MVPVVRVKTVEEAVDHCNANNLALQVAAGSPLLALHLNPTALSVSLISQATHVVTLFSDMSWARKLTDMQFLAYLPSMIMYLGDCLFSGC